MNDGLNNNNDLSNMEQNDYYNNDSYYSNNNYDNNYSDTTYEEKEKKSGIWWKILLVILIILIIIFLLLRFCGTGGKKSKDEMYTELTTRLCAAAETYVMNNPSVLDRTEPGKSAIIKLKVLADANLIESQIQNPYYDGGLFKNATVEKYYSMDSSIRLTVTSSATVNCEMVDNSKDVTAPELRLNGDAEITLAVGTEFEDPGYTATDDFDGDVTDKVQRSGNVDSSKAGTYELRYTVQDSAGNVSEKIRKIIFEEFNDIEVTMGSILDGVTPMISLKGANPYCMVKGTKFIEPGATATDNVDGNITDRIVVTNKVTGNLIGSFRIVYKVEDSSGNQAIAYRAVVVSTTCPNNNNEQNVSANSRPTITLVGKSSVTIAKGTEYIDLGATAYDKEDGDLTRKIVTDTSQVNIYTAGSYKVVYRVTDTAGATTTATRTVIVKDSVAGNPSVRFTEEKENISILVTKGKDDLLVAPKAVNENGVQVAVSMQIEDYTTKETVSNIDWNKLGKYRVIYTAIHGNGVVKQTKTIVVSIIEDSVTIGGKDAINVSVRKENCNITEADLIAGGVTFTTLGDATPIVTIEAKEGIACKIGTYKIVVKAKVTTGPEVLKEITVYVVNGQGIDGTLEVPSKVNITGNSATPTNPYNTNGVWVGGAVTGVTISFEATPKENTEIAHFEYSSDCNNVTDKVSKLSYNSGTLTWTNAGANNVCVRAVTTNGVAGPWSDPVKLYIDRTGPTVEFTHTWADEKEDWHSKENLELTYSAKDTESGLDHFEYTYDDVKAKKAEEIITYNEATGKLIVHENTEPARPELFVYVRAVDKAGNKGEWTVKPAYANMDTVKPFAPTLEVQNNNTSIVKIKANVTDQPSTRPSGFGKLIYQIDGGSDLEEKTNIITMPENNEKEAKTSNVKVWAVDKAGNKSDLSADTTITIKPIGVKVTGVDLKNGSTSIKDSGACHTNTVYINDTISLSATPIPSNADQKEVTWKSDDASIATIDENGKVKLHKVGSTVITAKIGSVSTTCKVTVSKKVIYVEEESNYSSGGSGTGNGTGVGNGNIVEPTVTIKYVTQDLSEKTESAQWRTHDTESAAIQYGSNWTGDPKEVIVYREVDKGDGNVERIPEKVVVVNPGNNTKTYNWQEYQELMNKSKIEIQEIKDSANKVVSSKINVVKEDGTVVEAKSLKDAITLAKETVDSKTTITTTKTTASGKTETQVHSTVTTKKEPNKTTTTQEVYSPTTGKTGTTIKTEVTSSGTKVTTTSHVTGYTQTVTKDNSGKVTSSTSSGGNVKTGSLDWYLLYG